MNAFSQVSAPYSSASTRSPKSVEYDALAQITGRIQSQDKKGQRGFKDLVSALHDNKKLWNIFAADVAHTNNPLPADLRARIFYLSEFTNHHTSKVLARQAGIQPLLEINIAVMRGLKGGEY
ncbi:flagellar biosynthesis regulator FlaF [Primorskyibacter sp. S87]|uniref:flagellar biosynthesis regulator FlaF n=1 Tax=Primorskyibacter sp. S87 TaxID=3415126 RepID=UPI003C7D9DB1